VERTTPVAQFASSDRRVALRDWSRAFPRAAFRDMPEVGILQNPSKFHWKKWEAVAAWQSGKC